MMAPLVRRTWNPCGMSPILVQRTRHHQKVSVIAALVVHPNRQSIRLYFRLYPGTNVDSLKVRAFLALLRRQMRCALVLVWDRLQAHRSPHVQALIRRDGHIHLEWFPPYAPELNPVEYAWSWLKTNPLANYAPLDVPELTQLARRHARSLQYRSSLLWSFVEHSPLSLRHH